jgi:hypothetical protein
MLDEVLARPDRREISAELQALLRRPPSSTPRGFRAFHCSFCDRSRDEVRKLIAGPRVFICDDCAGDAGGLLGASGWRFDAG